MRFYQSLHSSTVDGTTLVIRHIHNVEELSGIFIYLYIRLFIVNSKSFQKIDRKILLCIR